MTPPRNSNIGKIYYLIPEMQTREFKPRWFLSDLLKGNGGKHIQKYWFRKPKPVGGIKVIFQHCMILQELGYDAHPLRLGKYEGNFFGYPIETLSVDNVGYTLADNDIVVVPEYLPETIKKFQCGTKILFAQNWPHLYQRSLMKTAGISYIEYGYDYILSCSQFISNKLHREPANRVHLVNNFIDHSIFKPDPSARIEGRIMALPRKNADTLKEIQKILENENYQFHLVDGLTEAEIVTEYQKSDIFLATGYPEGFGLPPLEAMACGACVAGFTGGGAGEYMVDGSTALVADDGDARKASQHIKRLMEDKLLKENIRAMGSKATKSYSRERTLSQLGAFYSSLNTDMVSAQTRDAETSEIGTISPENGFPNKHPCTSKAVTTGGTR